jgi:hypothetical protein
MKIAIAERLHPFSHEVGTKFVLPKTSWVVQVFPARLNFCDLEGTSAPFFLAFDFQGPIRAFTAELDLERSCLRIFGTTQKGYMRYQLCAKEDRIWLTIEKTPEQKVLCQRSFPFEEFSLVRQESIAIARGIKGSESIACQERLSLGMHRSQDWDLVRRRLDFKEIFPHWLRLASLAPPTQICDREAFGNFFLLNLCRKKIEEGEREAVLEFFEQFFLSAFEGVLTPRLRDTGFQGIAQGTESAQSLSPLALLAEGGKLIRSLFIQEEEGEIVLLPCLPPQFHCGRMIGIRILDDQGTLDFQWSKKTLKSVTLYSAFDKEMCLRLPKAMRSFRLMRGKKMYKKVQVEGEGRVALQLEANKAIQLDRFI